MLTPKNAVEVTIVARLGDNPHYQGSIHDDAGARKFGYERALVPGAFIYGYISRLAVATWERDWLRSGTISSHSRKPVFDGERLTLHASALDDDGMGLRSDVVVRNSKGEDVASGFVALPHQPPSPPSIADYTVVPMAETAPFVDAGAMRIGDPIFSIRERTVGNTGAGRNNIVEDIDLDARSGEVVGIFGLLGSGAFDLARSLFGAHAGRVKGTMQVRGRTLSVRTPREAIRNGIAYVPAERKRDGLIEAHSIESNMTLAALGRLTRFGILDRHVELQRVQQYVATLKVKCGSVEQPISQLSGGNQQKVVAAKWLLTEPEVFILEEPTRGVDVNARIDFYALINELAAAGKAIIIVSTDLPEVLGMSDRVLAMCEGRLVREWKHREATEEDVMISATGEYREVA